MNKVIILSGLCALAFGQIQFQPGQVPSDRFQPGQNGLGGVQPNPSPFNQVQPLGGGQSPVAPPPFANKMTKERRLKICSTPITEHGSRDCLGQTRWHFKLTVRHGKKIATCAKKRDTCPGAPGKLVNNFGSRKECRQMCGPIQNMFIEQRKIDKALSESLKVKKEAQHAKKKVFVVKKKFKKFKNKKFVVKKKFFVKQAGDKNSAVEEAVDKADAAADKVERTVTKVAEDSQDTAEALAQETIDVEKEKAKAEENVRLLEDTKAETEAAAAAADLSDDYVQLNPGEKDLLSNVQDELRKLLGIFDKVLQHERNVVETMKEISEDMKDNES